MRRSDAVEGIPRGDTGRLLGTGKVHGRDEHKGRVGDGLECTRQDPQRKKTAETLCGGLGHEEGTPHEDVEGEIVAGRAALHQQVGRDGPDEPAKVEAAREQGVLVALQVEVLLEAEDGGVGAG